MHLKIIVILLLAFISAASYAQSRKNKKKSNKVESVVQPTTRDPLSQKDYTPRSARKSSKGPTYESEEKYYERMAMLDKTRRKNEKMEEKPQYSDPMYFGHKRPPKKHKPGKMKYCKECGIRH